MKWYSFHHPDISLPVIRRKVSGELITLLAGTAELVASRGLRTIYRKCYPSTQAFESSIARLRKNGLIATTRIDGSLPNLRLTPKAQSNLPDYLTPRKYWDKKWNKWWYILMFDVPEKERAYRDNLRNFLKNKRCGCLQKSVWVTPQDIRPDYDDLNRAAAVDSVAFLFEARTVLGFGNQSVITEAWNFKRINQLQELYIQFAKDNLKRLTESDVTEDELLQLLRMDNLAYAQAMSTDPLLPKELHPADYVGVQVAELHHTLIRKTVKKL